MVRAEYNDNDLDSSEKISHGAIFLVAFVFSLVLTVLTFLSGVAQKNILNLVPFFLIYFVCWVLLGYLREINRINEMR